MIIRIRYNQEYNGQTYLGCGKNQKNDLPEARNSLTAAFMVEMSPVSAVIQCTILDSTI